jgi:alpha-tubulin suppressor-like RCC1 family protein
MLGNIAQIAVGD